MPGTGRPDQAGRMTTLSQPEPTTTEHDVRSVGAVVLSAVILVTLLVGAAGVVGAVVDLAGWAMSTS
jgi:hypothetical protein